MGVCAILSGNHVNVHRGAAIHHGTCAKTTTEGAAQVVARSLTDPGTRHHIQHRVIVRKTFILAKGDFCKQRIFDDRIGFMPSDKTGSFISPA